MQPRVLIIGTVPYNKKSMSRAFESYFAGWEKENLAQIFSHTKTPCKGHCSTLYQITDKRILKRHFSKKVRTGKIFQYENLPEEWTDNNLEIGGSSFSKLYRFGKKHTPFTHLLRKWLWKRKYWNTEELNKWLDEFQPECVFLSFSDDFFIPQIALYVAEKFNIPIVSSIGDDYYFNGRFSLSPFYYIYKSSYRKLIRKVLSHKGSANYIGNKIRDKYNKEFHLDGETVYLTSSVGRKEFTPFNKEKPLITYFGNIRMGRNQSLNDIATTLGKINSSYELQIYSNEDDEKYYGLFDKNPNARFCGSVSYAEVQRKMSESDMTVVVEGFSKKDVDKSRYSVSTKAADALACGAAIFAYGSKDCGVIEYLKETESVAVCTTPTDLEECLRSFISDIDRQKRYYTNAVEITKKNHTLERSCAVFRGIVQKAIRKE